MEVIDLNGLKKIEKNSSERKKINNLSEKLKQQNKFTGKMSHKKGNKIDRDAI